MSFFMLASVNGKTSELIDARRNSSNPPAGRLVIKMERIVPAYLVRLIKNRDIVGIFVADDIEELAQVVDEGTDVPYCEYLELPRAA
jgi:hypothetical protein